MAAEQRRDSAEEPLDEWSADASPYNPLRSENPQDPDEGAGHWDLDDLDEDDSEITQGIINLGDVGDSSRVVGPPAERAEPDAYPELPGYRILGILGRGGMGVVYLAQQQAHKRLVALKAVLPDRNVASESLRRFRSEAEALAQLDHPNIVRIVDIGEFDGLPYCALQFVDGQPLDKYIAGKPVLPRQAAELVEAVSRAMQHAHDHGIVHRDLKPSNILLTKDGTPKVW
jgi:serine/threonine protein kinase